MKLVNELFSLIFPQRCLLCSGESKFLLCGHCLSKLDTNFSKCIICSRPVVSPNSVCINCLKEKRYFEKGFSLFNYKFGQVDKIIEFIKFYGYFRLVDFLFYFSDKIMSADIFDGVDCLIPVPMHRIDIKSRGYNQSVLIARVLSKITGIDVCYGVVKKIRRTRQQVGLSAVERKSNLRGAFTAAKFSGVRRVVIVDDVFTTGSTINEVAKLLKKRYISSNFFAVASTPGSDINL